MMGFAGKAWETNPTGGSIILSHTLVLMSPLLSRSGSPDFSSFGAADPDMGKQSAICELRGSLCHCRSAYLVFGALTEHNNSQIFRTDRLSIEVEINEINGSKGCTVEEHRYLKRPPRYLTLSQPLEARTVFLRLLGWTRPDP